MKALDKKSMQEMSKKLGMPSMSLVSYSIDSGVADLLPVHLAKKWNVIPLFKVENKVTIATADPLNLEAIDEIRRVLGFDVEAIIALENEIKDVVKEHYKGRSLLSEESSADVEIVEYEEEDAETEIAAEALEKEATGKRVVGTVNAILEKALEEKASDVHFEPTRNSLNVRLRIDGILEEAGKLSKSMHLPVVSRVKIISGMDVAERRIPQDGRVRVRIEGQVIDMRVASYPTVFGEAVAIRLLQEGGLITLEHLGLLERDQKIFEEIIERPHGMFLVTGPTGSGKSTTLYAALMRVTGKEKHILSIEDPVEHEITGVDQAQVNVKAGVTFASALRSMLRQDPDIIMVGEIRDRETADIAVRAAMTGHLVFSTLHTNTAAGAVVRLADIGVERYLISSSIIGVMAQRLVRRICGACKEEDLSQKAYRGKGCKKCRNTGYSGRIGLFEILRFDGELQEMINRGASEADLRGTLEKRNHRTLLHDGFEKIRTGITTIEEVKRVASE